MKKVLIIVSIQAALIDPLIPNSFLAIWHELGKMVDLNKSNALFLFPKFEYLQSELIINS